MKEKLTTRRVTRREEIQLLKIATQAVKSDFPNPERLGCAGSVGLKAIARRRISFSGFDDMVDHVATCAPCFAEYSRYRRQYRLRAFGTVVLACGVLAIAIFWRFAPRHPSPRKGTVVHDSANIVLKATLDLRNTTAERSVQSQPLNRADTPHVKRALLDLVVKLPIGTEDGMYSVQIRTSLNQPVVNAMGMATWDGNAEIMTTTIDLRDLKSGRYKLAIRRDGSSWHEYPVALD